MKDALQIRKLLGLGMLGLVAAVGAGCASSQKASNASPYASKYKTTDNRVIVVGESYPSDGGWKFKDPHLEECWLADGVRFSDYDTLYIAPTQSTAAVSDKDLQNHELAKEDLQLELRRSFQRLGVFSNVVTRESDIPPGAKALKMENTILEFAKGDRAARAFAGLYGAGQPKLRVQGRLVDGEKSVLTYSVQRSGTSAGSRMAGIWIGSDDIQRDDIKSMVVDTTDFVAAVAGKYEPRP